MNISRNVVRSFFILLNVCIKLIILVSYQYSNYNMNIEYLYDSSVGETNFHSSLFFIRAKILNRLRNLILRENTLYMHTM